MPPKQSPLPLEQYLRERIPLAAAMGVRVMLATPECVELSAPLEPNVNHSGTVFGGSAASIATLAAWALLHLRLQAGSINAQAVIQRSRMEYLRPIRAQFQALCRFEDETGWQRFSALLARRGRSRIALLAELSCEREPVGRFEGEFVAIAGL